jgi:hypothetical protein
MLRARGFAGRRRIAAALGALALVGAAQFAAPVAAEPGPGYFATDNVEWITTIPIETDGAGARLVGDYFYVTTSRYLSIYDVSSPEAPVRVGTLPLPQEPQFAEEDLDTNGDVLLVGTLGDVHVINVEDKSNPTITATVTGADEHTISCILDCKYAYGSGGVILDLRDPAAPKVVGDWTKGTAAPDGGHDVTEIAPGMVVTSTQPILLLDARKDPVHPKVVAMGSNEDNRYIHGNLWPQRGKARYLLVGGETGGNCGSEGSGQFMTWDTRGWRKHHTFKMVDELAMQNGLPTDGDMPANTFCAHWFDTHPTYKNGGLLAMDWYEHGTRFLKVNKKGKISEVGYFVALASAASAPYWINDEILYSVDYNRGIDILRFTGKP